MPITAPAFLMKYKWPRKKARDLWTFWYRITRGRLFVGQRMGHRLLFDLNNTVDKYLVAYGLYEEAQKRKLFAAAREAAQPGQPAVFIDVGAHWGIYALWAHDTGLFGRVVAVEADPRNLSQLNANLFLNDLSGKIDIVGAAAAAAPGMLSLVRSTGRDISTVASVTANSAAQSKVRAVALDDIEPIQGGLIVAKIDVEGYEPEVIKGMHRLMSENRCLLQIEVFDQTLSSFDKLMAECGFHSFGTIGNDRYYRNF